MRIRPAAENAAGLFYALMLQYDYQKCVFATQHPCFVTLTDKYMSSACFALPSQPKEQCYYHLSLQSIFALCFDAGFYINGFFESCCDDPEIPQVIAVRACKPAKEK